MANNEFSQRVEARLNELGKKPIPAALSVGLGRDFLRDLIDGRKESINSRKLPQVAEALEWSVEQLQSLASAAPASAEPRSRKRISMVPILDRVTAGKLASPMSQIPSDAVETLAASGLGSGEFFALRVDGSSMNRVSPEGSIIIVNTLDRKLVHGRFYVFSIRGDTTYKRWNAKPGYLEPYSTDEAHAPIFITKKRDMEVIGRVKRTVLDL